MPSLTELRQQLAELEHQTQERGSVAAASTVASIRPLKSIPSQQQLEVEMSSTRSVASSSRTESVASVSTERTAKPSSYNFTANDIEESAVLSAAYRAVNRDCKKTDSGVRYGICRILVGKQRSTPSSSAPKVNEGGSVSAAALDDDEAQTANLRPIESATDSSPPPIPALLLLTARRITSLLLLSPHLYFLAPSDTRGGWNGVVLLGSEVHMVETAIEGLRARFGRRLRANAGRRGSKEDKGRVWTGWIDGLDGWGLEDENSIWSILGRAAVTVIPKDELNGEDRAREPPRPVPPPSSRGIEELVKRARKKFAGLTPKEAWDELQQPLPLPQTSSAYNHDGTSSKLTKARYLIDLRPSEIQQSQGRIPNARSISLTILEISLDPRLPLASPHPGTLLTGARGRISIATDYDVRYILLSEDGTASSLAVLRLMEMGLWNCTDVVGGFDAWRESGLPFYN